MSIHSVPDVLNSACASRAFPVRLEVASDGLALVTFEKTNNSSNLLDAKTLRVLANILDDLASRPDLRGVIFSSVTPSVFIAGTDLQEFLTAPDREAWLQLGQETFSKIAALPGITVAAIRGACGGGGLELALACDYRLASDERETRIGLPEVTFGLIPAWGGCTRLPRLIGLSGALAIILRGDLLPAQRAQSVGLVDALAGPDQLLNAARDFVIKGKRPRPRLDLSEMAIAPLTVWRARKSLREKTRSHYPAPLAAIDVMTKSLWRTIPQSLVAERSAILQLAESPVCRNLFRTSCLETQARRKAALGARRIEKAAVIGAGVMGAGIAQWLAQRGIEVLLHDVSAEPLTRASQHIDQLFADAERRGFLSAAEALAGRARMSSSLGAVPMEGVDLVIESVVEKMPIKKRIFAEIEDGTHSAPLFASNTSALSVGEISRSLHHPERVVGLHFFNPVHRMKLVEVVRNEAASPETIDRAVTFVQQIGKYPVVVKDQPGFLANRILFPYLLEAASLFELGASLQDIDQSMLDFGMPMGPLRLLDEIGLDVFIDVAETLCAAYPDRMRLPGYLGRLVQSGAKGRKSGRGFYLYQDGETRGANRAAVSYQYSRARASLRREELASRMVFLMINEAAFCLEDEIVRLPRDVDFAMIMGTGFAPFRGGPLRHADAFGIGRLTENLRRLSDAGERQFVPCPWLVEMSGRERNFYGD